MERYLEMLKQLSDKSPVDEDPYARLISTRYHLDQPYILFDNRINEGRNPIQELNLLAKSFPSVAEHVATWDPAWIKKISSVTMTCMKKG